MHRSQLRLMGAATYAFGLVPTHSLTARISRLVFGRFGFIVHRLLNFLGPTAFYLRRHTKMTSLRCVYVPYFQMDAKAELRVETAFGSAKLSTFLNNLSLPAHADPDLQLIALKIPPADVLQYQPLDIVEHLQAKVLDEAPEVVKFEFTPAVIANAPLEEVQLPPLFSSIPTLKLPSTTTREDMVKLLKTFLGKDVKEPEGLQTDSKLQQKITSFALKYASMRPLLLPIYYMEYTNSSRYFESLDKSRLTLVYPGWMPIWKYIPIVNVHTKHDTKIPSSQGLPPRRTWSESFDSIGCDLDIAFEPKIPIPTGLKTSHNGMNSFVYENIRDRLEVAFCTHQLRKRIFGWIQTVLGSDLAAFQKAEHARISSARSEGQVRTPAAQEAALGPFIDWSSPLITAPSGCDGTSQFRDGNAYFKTDMVIQWMKNCLYYVKKSPTYKDNSERTIEFINQAEPFRDQHKPAWLGDWSPDIQARLPNFLRGDKSPPPMREEERVEPDTMQRETSRIVGELARWKAAIRAHQRDPRDGKR